MSSKYVLFCFLALTPFLLNAQDQHVAFAIKQPDTIRPTCINMGFGGSYVNFRDFATSPVFYKGLTGNFAAYRHVSGKDRESTQGFQIGHGETSINNSTQYSNSTVSFLEIIHTELYQLPLSTPKTWNFKAGGTISLTGNLRNNPDFNNNSFGVEGIGTLFGSFKIKRDISRNRHKTWDLKLFEMKFIPRKRTLAWQMDVALVNSTFRNGYAYYEHASIQNNDKKFDLYEFHIFRGYRLKSSLEYNIYLNNNNAIRFSYIWDAYHTGRDYAKLEMAKHYLMFSFLYSLNEPVKTSDIK
ncbi:MAG: hypothetical protein ACOCPM_05985 [Bacteroidales bacterium]